MNMITHIPPEVHQGSPVVFDDIEDLLSYVFDDTGVQGSEDFVGKYQDILDGPDYDQLTYDQFYSELISLYKTIYQSVL